MRTLASRLRRPQIRARVSPSVVQRCGDHACPPSGCGSREPEDRLFRSARGRPAPGLGSALSMARAHGRPLPGPLARTMSLQLGHDFSDVRVHDDAQAAASAANYAADAYTFGSHIVFGAGQYQPGSESGQRLLMHELAHVVQASSGGTAAGISSPSDASEQEASRVAATGGTGRHAGVGATPSGAIQRQASPGAQKTSMPGSSMPAEKWSQTLEAAYRAQGDFRRAAAIRSCRERGGRSCDLVLTQSEVHALYNGAQEAKGDEKRVRADVSRVVPGQLGPASGLPVTATPALGLLAPLPNVPVPPVPGIPPPTVPLAGAGAGEVGVAVGTGETAAAATGISAGAVAATGALAIIAICVIAGIELWQFGKFQAELESRGFIILDDALAVCIKGCHTSPVRLPTFREFPDTPTFPQPEARLRPRDEETIRRWLDQVPEPTQGTKEQPRPAPRYRPGDPDVEDEERRGCRGTATYPRGGNTCHDQFATSVSGVTREWLVTTPYGLSESFDARSPGGNTLYEMKTGHGFLGIRNPTPRQQDMIDRTRERWQRQAATQQLVADLCGYDLVWYFTNEAARAYADGIIQARTVRVPFRCDADGERQRR